MTGGITVEEITTAERLHALHAQWSQLLERCPHATPFQSPEWLTAWWQHFSPGELWTAALWANATLVGIAPFFLEMPARKLLPIGIGISDYLDVIIDPEFAGPSIAALLQHLVENCSRWQHCDFQDLAPSSYLAGIRPPDSLHVDVQRMRPCPILHLPGSWRQFLDTLSSGLRRNSRRYRAQLEHSGPVEFQLADRNTLDGYLDEFFALHEAWRTGRGEAGVLSNRSLQAFHRDAARRFLERGWLRLHRMECGGHAVGMLYLFSMRGRAYSYLGAFEPRMARYSPGTLLVAHAIEAAISEQLSEYDFLRGDEAYKYAWGSRNRYTLRMILSHG